MWDSVDNSELLNRAMEAHYADITCAVRRRGHPSSTARDVVHDVYVKLAARPEVLQNKRSIKAFLCRAAINLGIDRQRRDMKEARLFSGSERDALSVASSGNAPDHSLEIEARLAALREAIAELPERRRVVVSTVDGLVALAWKRGQIAVDNAPLSYVVEEMNRHFHGRIVVAGSALASRRVSGTIKVAETDDALAFVTKALGVKTTRLGPLIVIRRQTTLEEIVRERHDAVVGEVRATMKLDPKRLMLDLQELLAQSEGRQHNYLLFYRVKTAKVVIVHVLHGATDYGAILCSVISFGRPDWGDLAREPRGLSRQRFAIAV